PAQPRSYDRGVVVKPGAPGAGDLLMIPGPIGMRYGERLVPRLENGELASQDLPTEYRTRRWLALAPRIGRDIFLKLHAHGALEQNAKALLLEGGLERLFQMLSAEI